MGLASAPAAATVLVWAEVCTGERVLLVERNLRTWLQEGGGSGS